MAKTILINAVAAKTGGAKTIVESYANFVAKESLAHKAIFIAGFKCPSGIENCKNIKWICKPTSGLFTVLFSLIFVYFYFLYYRSNVLISFCNINCLLLSRKSKITYFHQLKALDPKFNETKLRVIRWYFTMFKSEKVVVQSELIREKFMDHFKSKEHRVAVSWPGVFVNRSCELNTNGRTGEHSDIVIPVTSFESEHKNFLFVKELLKILPKYLTIKITSDAPIRELSADDAKVFIGPQDRARLIEMFASAQVVILPSTHESVGLPIFEALSLGTPVIGLDVDYLRYYKKKFSINSGLYLVNTPEDVLIIMEEIKSGGVKVSSKHDFISGDWGAIEQMFGEGL